MHHMAIFGLNYFIMVQKLSGSEMIQNFLLISFLVEKKQNVGKNRFTKKRIPFMTLERMKAIKINQSPGNECRQGER